ncbi:MAG: ABC transporter permease [Oscillospiraceae bacterium]|nr:ABC transporter permease [Oscillospiraceae bacterium]
MLKYIFKQMRRSAVTNALFTLLLALSGALLCITAALWFTAERSLRDVDEIITTIGMPDMRGIWEVTVENFDTADITEIETPQGLLSLEGNGALLLDGVSPVAEYLYEHGFDSVQELMEHGTEVLIFNADGTTEGFGFGSGGGLFVFGPDDFAAFNDHFRREFVREVEEPRNLVFSRGGGLNNAYNLIYILWLSAEENFRNNARVQLAENNLQMARETLLDIDSIDHGGLLSRDERRVFGAFSGDAESVPLRMAGIGIEVGLARFSPQGFVVLAVTAIDFESSWIAADYVYWFDGENISHVEEFQAGGTRLRVDEVLHSHPDMRIPFTIGVNNMRFSDGSYAFEEGSSYIVMGQLRAGTHMGMVNPDHIIIDFPPMDIVRMQTGYIEDVSEIRSLGYLGWIFELVRVPSDLWVEIDEQRPFVQEYEHVYYVFYDGEYTRLSESVVANLPEDHEYEITQELVPIGIRVPALENSGWPTAPPLDIPTIGGAAHVPTHEFWQIAPVDELNELVIDENFLMQIDEGLPLVTPVEGWWVMHGAGQSPMLQHVLELPRSQFPIDVMQTVSIRPQEWNPLDFGFMPLEGSLEQFFATEQWEQIASHIERVNISEASFPVITTNDPISIFELHQQRNLIYDGRKFTYEEVRDGERVALISRDFALHNELSIGDTISMELYNAALERTVVTYPSGLEAGGAEFYRTMWLPTLYSAELQRTVPTEFTVVGIYRTSITGQALRLDYVIPRNTVFIPDRSVSVLSGVPISASAYDYIPLIDDALIVANGRTYEVIAVLNSHSYGLGNFFMFFDQGYESLVGILNNLLFGTTWILVLAASAWAVVAFVFAMFFVAQKRKEAALLHAMGLKRGKRTLWIFIQCAIVILLSVAISLAITLPLYSDIVEVAAGAAEDFAHELRDLRLSDAADTGLRASIPVSEEPIDTVIAAGGAFVLLLVIAALVSARSSVFRSLGSKVED